ncbi:hypothetical protein DT019_02950 [Streptomyces sp. SDr-06]|uniref:hypothetical protein n=1 Tax=Streptomyces sp. SDr-06 TaxID=2267702 RepID=UPI000DE92695|nr:hypothetical protein [Streptomyces sp. SDr-06]RCH70461.1 hypothetical protein DT019_02950 [Streptomyces sp. SDr-06]
MSALVDHLHNLLSRFASIGKADIEQVVTAVEEHLAPLLDQARTELLADLQKLIADMKTDEAKLAAEIAKLLGNAPVEPPAPQA